MLTARLLNNAARQLSKLDRPVARRIIDSIDWLAEHFEDVTPDPLKGPLSGLFKYRVGDYRVIYEPILNERVIVVHEIAHRRHIYKRAGR